MIIAVPASLTARRRPVLVWVILTVYALGLVVILAGLYGVFSGAVRLHVRDAEFYAAFGTLNFAAAGASIVLAIGFMVQLFRMRKSAAYWVTAPFLVGLLKQLWYQPQLVRLGYSPVGAVVGVALSFLTVLYVWHLKRTAVLR